MQSGYARQYANYNNEKALADPIDYTSDEYDNLYDLLDSATNGEAASSGTGTASSDENKGQFWNNLNSILSTAGDTAAVVAEGVIGIQNAGEGGQAQPVVIDDGSSGPGYKTIAFIAGGALLVFAIVKLAQN